MGQRYDQDLELRIEMVEKYKTRRSTNENPLSLKLSLGQNDGVSIALTQPTANLATRHSQLPQSSLRNSSFTLPYLLLWFRSGKNLDLCLLALCSCILSLLCHQTVSSLPSSPTLTGNSTPITSPVAGLSRIDLAIKAGLFTTSSQTEEETERSRKK